MAICLWQHGAEMSRDGDFSGEVVSIELIAAACSWPTNDAQRLADALQQVGLIAVHPKLRVRGLDRYRRTWEKNANFHRMSAKSRPQVPSTGTLTAKRRRLTAIDGAQDEDEDEEEVTTLSSKLDPPPASFLVVFEHWRQVMKCPKAKPVKERRKAVAARLAEGYSVGDLKLAVDGCSKTPHNMGQNDNHTPYNDLELICRDGSNVERFMRATGVQQTIDVTTANQDPYTESA